MRWLAILSLMLAAWSACAAASAQDSCGRDPCYDPTYGCGPFLPDYYELPVQTVYFTAEMVAFLRDGQPYQAFAALDTPSDVVLSTDNLNGVYQPGLWLMAGLRLNECWAVEGSFLGLLEWDESVAVRDLTPNVEGTVGNLFSPMTDFGQPAEIGLDYNTLASVRLRSQFNNFELNLRQRLNNPGPAAEVSAIYGLRYINLRERLEYQTRSLVPVPDGTFNEVDVATSNNMFGLQLGAMFDLQLHYRCWIGIEAKGMVLSNQARQTTDYTVGPLGDEGTFTSGTSQQTRATLGADVAVTLVWAFTPSLLGRVGYQAIYFDGLALAADNFVHNAHFLTNDPSQLARDGQLVFHGPFAGLTLTW